jgi:ABC-type multidrug transport system fused ATPase/permease subunit
LKKNIGWFDDRDNAPGILNSVLAKDVQSLNGASTEGSAVIMESSFAMIVGLALGFSFHWKISLVALGCVPFMVVGGAIDAKFQAGYSEDDEDSYKKANLLAGDTILNYRTVASFGHDYLIVKEYDRMVEEPIKQSFKKAQTIGFCFGFSQFVQNAVFALLYWAGAKFQVSEGVQDGANIFIATFAMMFGSFAAGQANQYGPDMGKA